MHSSHASALNSKHEGLDAQIRSEMNRPFPDQAALRQLKKRKLRIKEELSRS
jgi:hypothetical protein